MASIDLPFSVMAPPLGNNRQVGEKAIELQGGHGATAQLRVQALGHTGELKRIECNNLM